MIVWDENQYNIKEVGFIDYDLCHSMYFQYIDSFKIDASTIAKKKDVYCDTSTKISTPPSKILSVLHYLFTNFFELKITDKTWIIITLHSSPFFQIVTPFLQCSNQDINNLKLYLFIFNILYVNIHKKNDSQTMNDFFSMFDKDDDSEITINYFKFKKIFNIYKKIIIRYLEFDNEIDMKNSTVKSFFEKLKNFINNPFFTDSNNYNNYFDEDYYLSHNIEYDIIVTKIDDAQVTNLTEKEKSNNDKLSQRLSRVEDLIYNDAYLSEPDPKVKPENDPSDEKQILEALLSEEEEEEEETNE
jgi:hypothetical protein